jgi:hypothetical protein
METGIDHLKHQLQIETDPLVKWRIEKQIELLEDAAEIHLVNSYRHNKDENEYRTI